MRSPILGLFLSPLFASTSLGAGTHRASGAHAPAAFPSAILQALDSQVRALQPALGDPTKIGPALLRLVDAGQPQIADEQLNEVAATIILTRSLSDLRYYSELQARLVAHPSRANESMIASLMHLRGAVQSSERTRDAFEQTLKPLQTALAGHTSFDSACTALDSFFESTKTGQERFSTAVWVGHDFPRGGKGLEGRLHPFQAHATPVEGSHVIVPPPGAIVAQDRTLTPEHARAVQIAHELTAAKAASRPYGMEDVRSFLAVLDAGQVSVGNLYEATVISRKTQEEDSRSLDLHRDEITRGYEVLALNLFRGWREKILRDAERITTQRPNLAPIIAFLKNESPPSTIKQLRDLYEKRPDVDDVSPAHYQEGLVDFSNGLIPNDFLHINMARFHGYENELGVTSLRIYLNPALEAIPEFAQRLIVLAGNQNPLYFKITDYSLNKTSPSLGRRDKIVVYTNDIDAPRLLAIIEQIRNEHPRWFRGRETPGLLMPWGDGIGIGADPTAEQGETFMMKKTTFNALRGRILGQAWKAVAEDLRQENRSAGPSPTIEEILKRTSAERLLPLAQKRFREAAAAYGVNPDNPAFNVTPANISAQVAARVIGLKNDKKWEQALEVIRQFKEFYPQQYQADEHQIERVIGILQNAIREHQASPKP